MMKYIIILILVFSCNVAWGEESSLTKITDELLDEQRVGNCFDRPYLLHLLREESKRFSKEIEQLKDRLVELENQPHLKDLKDAEVDLTSLGCPYCGIDSHSHIHPSMELCK